MPKGDETMSEYIIAAASTADLPQKFYDLHNVPVIRYTYSVDMKVFEDDCQPQTRAAAYADMRGGALYTTSMINAQTYVDFFRKLLREGKDVLFLDMSREMSSSYQASHEAARLVQQEFPRQKLVLPDTRCVSGGLGVLVTEAVRQHEQGMPLGSLVEWIERNKLHIMHRFTVDDLNYLKRGGRVSNASALIGSLLSIKPVLYVPDDGKLTVAQKVRGRKAALNAIIDGVKRDIDDDNQVIYILHADCLRDAEYVQARLQELYPTVKGIEISDLGIIIGAHCGPGLLAVFYFGKGRLP